MTSTTLGMLETHPQSVSLDRARLAATIDALVACSETCTACADACLGEGMVAELATCIRLNLDCADICAAAARILSRHTGYDGNVSRTLLHACSLACKSCGDECASHAERHEHCRLCAQACRRCEQACRELLAAMA